MNDALRRRRRSVLVHGLGGVAFLLAACANELLGEPTIDTLGFAAGGVALILFGTGRIYRPGIARLPDRIICRFIPWSEARPYGALIFVPLLGLWMIASVPQFSNNEAFANSDPLVRLAGALIIAVTPVSFYFFRREWRRCILCITPTELVVSLPEERHALHEIRREDVQSIDLAIGRRVNRGWTEMTQITFRPGDYSPRDSATVLIGPSNSHNAVWLTVEPANVLTALEVWKDADSADTGLLDRIEAILRAHGDGSKPNPADGG